MEHNKQVSILSQLAKGIIAQEPDIESLVGDTWTRKIDTFLAETSHVVKKKRYNLFRNEFKDFRFTPNNKEGYYEVFEQLHPLGPKAAKQEIRDDIDTKIASYTNDEEREGYIRDIYHSIPEDMVPNLERYFTPLGDKIQAQNTQNIRAAQILEFTNIHIPQLNKKLKDSKLDPNTSLPVYRELLTKILENDLMDYFEVDSTTGQFTILSPEGDRIPAYAIPDSNNIRDRLYLETDIGPLITKVLKKHLDKARQDVKESAIKTTELLYKNLTSLPEDIQTNVIIDRAFNDPKTAVDKIHHGINKVVTGKILEQKTNTIEDIVFQWKTQRDRISLAIDERITDGRKR